MREIKFRQPLFSRGKFSGFHYWGFISDGNFSGPTGELVKAREQSQQFTGLLDRSGKEIFEGDVVDGINIDGQEYPSGEVVFNAGCFSIKTKHFQHVYEPCLYEAWEEMLFIIGNIYENPELLKGE